MKLVSSGVYLRKHDHVYILEDGTELTKSVTNIVDSQFPYFDKELIARSLTKRVPKYQHLTAEELIDEWNEARDHGSLVHEELDLYIKEGTEPFEDKSIAGRDWFDENISKYGDQFFSEILVYSKDYEIAGMIDLLVFNSKTKKCSIFDWKTSKKIDRTNSKKAITAECYGLKNCRFDQYSLQLSFYSYLLEKSHGIKVNDQYIVHLMEDDVDKIKADNHYGIVEKIIEKRLVYKEESDDEENDYELEKDYLDKANYKDVDDSFDDWRKTDEYKAEIKSADYKIKKLEEDKTNDDVEGAWIGYLIFGFCFIWIIVSILNHLN